MSLLKSDPSSQQGNRGVTTRPPAVALAVIDSSDAEQYDKVTGFRISSSNPARVYINNQEAILFGYMTRISLTEIAIQYGTPNVNDYNNTITIGCFTPLGVFVQAIRVTIPNGFYTGPRLGIVLAIALNANAALDDFFGPDSFEISIGGLQCGTGSPAVANSIQTAADSRFVIDTSSLLGRFAVLPSNGSLGGLPKLADDLTNMMGITPTLSSASSYKNIQGGYSSMQYTPYLDVTSTQLTRNQVIRDGSSKKGGIGSSLLARVYLDNEDFQARVITIQYGAESVVVTSTDNAIGTTEGTLRREFAYPKQIQWSATENIDFIDIQVLDSKGRPLYYSPGATVFASGDFLQLDNTADIYISIQATES